MTRGKFSSKQIYDSKIKKLKLIRKKIREKDHSSSELCALIYGKKYSSTNLRTTQNYLKQLVDLDLIEYDKEQRVYHSFGSKKRSYSEMELSRALNHSKLLFTSSNYELFFDDLDPNLTFFKIAYDQEKYHNQISHLKTGYFKEIWSLVEKYLKK